MVSYGSQALFLADERNNCKALRMMVRINVVALAISLGPWCLAGPHSTGPPSANSPDQTWSTPSVLASGPWLKVAVAADGLYRITADQLRQAGWSPAQINPHHLQLYGYGGGMLPQPLDSTYFTDPPENAIWVAGAEDNRFDEQDEIIFYGQSPGHLRYRPAGSGYALHYEKNLYADSSYYFLTVGEKPGKRVATVPSGSEVGGIITEYSAYAAYENDAFNLRKSDAGSGREWYGESFSEGQTRTIPLGLAGITDGPVRVSVEVLGTLTAASSFMISLNGTALGTLPVAAIATARYAAKGAEARATFDLPTSSIGGAALTVGLAYQGGGTAYLNKIVVEASRPLRYEQPFTFRSLPGADQAQATFRLATAPTDLMVWDVTDPQAPSRSELTFREAEATFTVPSGTLREFAAAARRDLPTATVLGAVTPQNLKDGNVPNLVIVSPPAFRAEAERLAELRRTHDKLRVRVVSLPEIYHEFSSGRQDVSAIRNYLKYLYDTEASQIKYLLLFGKGSYDYRDYRAANTNFVPTYESRNSVHPIFSYSSDDYYGFLEDNEGAWEEDFAGDHTMEIGVGRLPVKSVAEARTVVDKLIHYATSSQTQGNWRNRVVFVADDGDSNKHQRDAEQLASVVDTAYAAFTTSKIYLDAFPQEALPGGEAAPAVNRRIERDLKQGALIMNYTGHGSETRWAQENIFNVNTISQLRNYDQLPFFVTATCEFGRHDDPDRVSGAEQLVLSERGGAIGLVTTARPVYSNTNLLLNRAFYAQVFAPRDGEFLTVGEIFRRTKNNALSGPVNRNFSLLGDPSMRLNYPQDRVVLARPEVRQADGTYVSSDTLAALDEVRLTGQVVRRGSGALLTDFTGSVLVEVLDKATQASTRGSNDASMQFSERSSVLYRGRARVRDGSFVLHLVMPKNIVYQAGTGKISAYAQGGASDAHGADQTFAIGGTSRRISEDTTPPQIRLYMDDTTFVAGGFTGSRTQLVARLSDDHGINIATTSLGQEMVATLTHQETGTTTEWELDEFYVADMDTYRSGSVTYPLDNLADGHYALTLRAGDTYNNFSEAQTTFVVGEEQQLQLRSVYNFPNPFGKETTFVLDHNRPGDDLSVRIDIVDGQGRVAASLAQEYPKSATRLEATWGRGSQSARIGQPGVYVARITVRSLTDQQACRKFHKLIITP